MTNICIIPARGGSKRIPKKNIKKFLGKPIINYVIDNVKKTKLFKKIIVSTDDKMIRNIIQNKGVIVHKRNKKLSKDNVTTKEVIFDIIKNKKLQLSETDTICCIYPTSVFCTVNILKKARKLLSRNINYVFSAVRYTHPILRSFKKKKNNRPEMYFKKFELTETNKLPYAFHDAGQFYFGWTDSWLKKKNFFNSNSKFIEFNLLQCHDIDTLEDWSISEIKYKNFLKK